MRRHGCNKRGFLPSWALAALVSIAILMPTAPSWAESDVKIEWLTWSFFRITSPSGKVILTNPWVTNPDSKTTLADIAEADIILVAAGHPDEVGQTVEIANTTGAMVVATHELNFGPFKDEIPPEQLTSVQPGSTIMVDGIRIRIVNAAHGNGPAGGAALGFFITFENGYTLYFSGSTDVTQDMVLWGELFKPDGAILYMPNGFRADEVAVMAQMLSEKNPNLKTVIPHHNRLEPAAGSTPAELGEAMATLGIEAKLLEPELGEVYSLTK